MPPALTPFALENASLLRRLEARNFTTKTELALAMGRDLSNLNKTLKVLAEQGLANADATLTEAGANAVRELDRLDGREPRPAPTQTAGDGLPDGYALLHPAQIRVGPLNPRKHFDEDAIAELAESIARDGLLENLVVRQVAGDSYIEFEGRKLPLYELVAGERRYRAIMNLARAGRWAADRRLLCKVAELDDAGHRRVALVENLQRKDLRPVDEAQALRELMDVTGQGTAEVAQEIGFTQRFVQQRLQLLQLPDDLRERLNTGELTVEDGRTAATLWGKLPAIKQVELREGKIRVADAKAWLAQQPEPHDFPPEELLILLEIAWEVAKGSHGYWTSIPCDYRLPALPRAMETAEWIRFTTRDWGEEVGAMKVQLTLKGFNQVAGMTGGDQNQLTRAGIEPLLHRMRVLTVAGSPLADDHVPQAFAKVDALFKAKQHVTPWLNAPFGRDPKVVERLKATAAENAARHEQWQRDNAEKLAQRAADQEARDARAIRARDLMLGFDNAARDEVLEILQAEYPLPWSWSADRYVGGILDANGHYVDLADLGAVSMMIAAIVNYWASGAPTELWRPDDQEDEEADSAEPEEAAA